MHDGHGREDVVLGDVLDILRSSLSYSIELGLLLNHVQELHVHKLEEEVVGGGTVVLNLQLLVLLEVGHLVLDPWHPAPKSLCVFLPKENQNYVNIFSSKMVKLGRPRPPNIKMIFFTWTA